MPSYIFFGYYLNNSKSTMVYIDYKLKVNVYSKIDGIYNII